MVLKLARTRSLASVYAQADVRAGQHPIYLLYLFKTDAFNAAQRNNSYNTRQYASVLFDDRETGMRAAHGCAREEDGIKAS